MIKILIVSHNPHMLRELDIYFRRYGLLVNAAASFKAALELLKEVNFRLIVMDASFKEKILFQEIDGPPIVYIGEAFGEIPKMRFEDDFLIRPFRPNEFQAVINKQLEQNRQRSFKLGDLHLDATKNLMKVKDSIVTLGKKEMEVMMMLSLKAGKIVHKNHLMTVERMTQLKRKIKCVGGEALELKSIGKHCYTLLWMKPGV